MHTMTTRSYTCIHHHHRPYMFSFTCTHDSSALCHARSTGLPTQLRAAPARQPHPRRGSVQLELACVACTEDLLHSTHLSILSAILLFYLWACRTKPYLHRRSITTASGGSIVANNRSGRSHLIWRWMETETTHVRRTVLGLHWGRMKSTVSIARGGNRISRHANAPSLPAALRTSIEQTPQKQSLTLVSSTNSTPRPCDP